MASATALSTAARSVERGLAPGVLGRMCGVEGQLDIFGGGPGHLAEGLAVDRADVRHVLAFDRGHPVPADEVVVPRLHLDQAAGPTRSHEDLRRRRTRCGGRFLSQGHFSSSMDRTH